MHERTLFTLHGLNRYHLFSPSSCLPPCSSFVPNIFPWLDIPCFYLFFMDPLTAVQQTPGGAVLFVSCTKAPGLEQVVVNMQLLSLLRFMEMFPYLCPSLGNVHRSCLWCLAWLTNPLLHITEHLRMIADFSSWSPLNGFVCSLLLLLSQVFRVQLHHWLCLTYVGSDCTFIKGCIVSLLSRGSSWN
jgi:hypothetical protein